MCDAGPFNWVSRNIEYVLAILESSKQIFPRLNFGSTGNVTRANVPQTTLALDSGATIHFFSNPELLKLIKESTNKLTVHCGGSSFQHGTVGQAILVLILKIQMPNTHVGTVERRLCHLVSQRRR